MLRLECHLELYLRRVISDVVDQITRSPEDENNENVDDDANSIKFALLGSISETSFSIAQKLLLMHITLLKKKKKRNLYCTNLTQKENS